MTIIDLNNIIVVSVAACFLLMGVVALIKPENVTSCFSLKSITADMRNEVRAVYGGFGVMICAVLLATLRVESIREGVVLTVSLALLGMAMGRLVSLMVERPPGKYPYIFLAFEIVAGGALLFVWWSVAGDQIPGIGE